MRRPKTTDEVCGKLGVALGLLAKEIEFVLLVAVAQISAIWHR